MKILQLGKFYPIRGGVEKVAFSLTEGLSAQGIPCDMLCASFDGNKQMQTIPLNEHGHIIVVPTWLKAAGTMLAPKMIGWLRKHKQEYDIIHIHHPDPMAALALRLSGYRGRVILHWHSDILSQRFFLFFYRPLQNWLIRRAERIIGTTPVYVRESPHLAHAQGKCTAVPIGIDPLQPDPQRVAAIRNRYPGQKLILSVGRLVPYKGYPYLIDAIALLPGEYHLVIGGTGPLKEQLEQQIQEKNLQERITLTGYLDDADLPAWFGACDCFVLTSTMKTEAFGIVQIEAMSCHKPVVATRIPHSGVSWVNEDGVSGRNVTPGKPEEYAATIQEVTTNCAEFGESAYLRYLNCFTREQMILKIKELYEDS
jgi:rhamnosyl/mannosyltransferase